jgi:hypothetical protein
VYRGNDFAQWLDPLGRIGVCGQHLTGDLSFGGQAGGGDLKETIRAAVEPLPRGVRLPVRRVLHADVKAGLTCVCYFGAEVCVVSVATIWSAIACTSSGNAAAS